LPWGCMGDTRNAKNTWGSQSHGGEKRGKYYVERVSGLGSDYPKKKKEGRAGPNKLKKKTKKRRKRDISCRRKGRRFLVFERWESNIQ